MVAVEKREKVDVYPQTPEEGEIDRFLDGFNVSEHHWGYQPYREHRYRAPNGIVRQVFDISGRERILNVWDDPSRPVHGFNALITEECQRPLSMGVPGTRLESVIQTQEFGVQFSSSYMDWLQTYDDTLYTHIRQLLYTKADFATTPTQHILTLLPQRMADIQVSLGIQMYHEDFPNRVGPIAFWPAELAVQADTNEQEGTIDLLARHGIKVLTLRDDQFVEGTPDSPLYKIQTKRGNTMIVIPFSKQISGAYAFSHMNADSYSDMVFWQGTANGVNRMGANDLETFTNRKGVGYLDFTHWLYNVFLPEYRMQGKLQWQRRLDMAVPAELKRISSWSCEHGDGRWSGDPNCRCDASTPEEQPGKQADKRMLMNGLTNELNTSIAEIEFIAKKNDVPWEPEYIEWQLAIRKDLATGKIIDASTVRPEFQQLFLRIHNAMMGLQSCAFFFSEEYERQMARASLAEVEFLRNPRSQIIYSF